MYLSDPEKNAMKLHVNGRHASAQREKLVSANSDKDNMHLATYGYGALEQCAACPAFNKDPHVPIAGTSTVSMFNVKLEVDLFFLYGIIGRFFSKYPPPWSPFDREIPRRFGLPSATRRLGFSANQEHADG